MAAWSLWPYLFPGSLQWVDSPRLAWFLLWVFDASAILFDSTGQAVVSRKDAGQTGLRTIYVPGLMPCFDLNLFSHPLFLVVTDPRTQTSRILVEPHLIGAEFRKAWMPFYCKSWLPLTSFGVLYVTFFPGCYS